MTTADRMVPFLYPQGIQSNIVLHLVNTKVGVYGDALNKSSYQGYFLFLYDRLITILHI
jgi:hypothetical protein